MTIGTDEPIQDSFYNSIQYSNILFHMALLQKNGNVESSHLYLLKAEKLEEDFQLFLEQNQKSTMGKNAEIEYKNIQSNLTVANRNKRSFLQSCQQKLKIQSRNKVDKICSKTSRGFKFYKVVSQTPKGFDETVGSLVQPDLNIQKRQQQLNTKLEQVEESIFTEEMVLQGLRTQLQNDKNYNANLKRKLNELQAINNRLISKQSLCTYIKNTALFDQITSKAKIDKYKKEYSEVSKKDNQRIAQWLTKSKSFHKTQEQMRSDYLKSACKMHRLQEVNYEKTQELKKLTRTHTNYGKKDTLSQTIAEIENLVRQFFKLFRVISQNEANYRSIVLQTCGKPRKKLRVTATMDNIRVSQVQLINTFEERFEFKVESAYKIILHTYAMLKEGQKKMVMQFDEWTSIKQQRQAELKALQDKFNFLLSQHLGGQFQRSATLEDLKTATAEYHALSEQLHCRSKFLLDTNQFIRGCLNRFKRFFSKLTHPPAVEGYEDVKKKVLSSKGSYWTGQSQNGSPDNILKTLKGIFPELPLFVLQDAAQMLLSECKIANYLKNCKNLRKQMSLFDDQGSQFEPLRTMTRLSTQVDILFQVIKKISTKAADSFLSQIKHMLGLIIQCHSVIQTRQANRLRKITNVPPNIGFIMKGSLNKFYSVFVSKEDDEHPQDHIDNHLLANEVMKSQKDEEKIIVDIPLHLIRLRQELATINFDKINKN